jgi:hypothetical protein
MPPTDAPQLSGYTYGDSSIARSPVSLDELAALEELLHFGPTDVAALRRLGAILQDHLAEFDANLMGWVGPVAMTSVQRETDGSVDERYLTRAHARFLHGFLDTCRRVHNQVWLDHQHAVGLRHTRAAKNRLDGADGVVTHIPFRWLLAFLYPTTQAIRPLFTDLDTEEAEAMLQAWSKAVLLQVVLYSRAYVPASDW